MVRKAGVISDNKNSNNIVQCRRKVVMRKAGCLMAFKSLGMILLALSLCVSGCGDVAPKSGSNEILLGVNLELSGKYGKTGEMAVKGISLAVEEANLAGGINGRKIRLLIEDNESDPNLAKAIFSDQVKKGGVSAVIGPKNSDTAIPLGQLAEELKTPFVATNATHPRVTVDDSGRTKAYAFRACFSDPFQGTAMAAFTLKSLNKSRAALVIDASSEYSRGIASFFEQEMIKGGGVICCRAEYRSGEKNFSILIKELLKNEPEVIFMPGFSDEVAAFIPEVRKSGFSGPIIGSDSWDIETIARPDNKPYLSNVFYSDVFSQQDSDLRVASFNRKLAKVAEGRLANAAAVLGYDAALIVIDALKRSNGKAGEELRIALEQTSDVSGVTGKIRLNRKHDAEGSVIVLQISEGISGFRERISP